MRTVFVGAGEVSVKTAELLIQRGHEVVFIEEDKAKIDELSEELDCSFLHGDGSKPAILREVSPEQTDLLLCLSDNDQANIIATLVGRSLGFRRCITSIKDPEFESICRELGLEDTIIPTRTLSRYLADMAEGIDVVQLSTIIKDEARFFELTVDKQDVGSVADLALPEDAKVICYYRNERFSIAEDSTRLRKGDEVIILTHSKNLDELQERWQPDQEGDGRNTL